MSNMKKLTPKQMKQYHKSREKGFLYYVLMRGILMWGLPIGFGFALYKQFFQDDMTGWAINFPIWLIGGILFGSITWHAERTIYVKNMNLKENQPPK